MPILVGHCSNRGAHNFVAVLMNKRIDRMSGPGLKVENLAAVDHEAIEKGQQCQIMDTAG